MKNVSPFLIFLFLGFLIIIISILWTTSLGAPWIPTPLSTVKLMLEMAEINENDVVYDLGCGDGRILIITVRNFGARAVGVEIDPLRFAFVQILITLLRKRNRIQVKFGNLFDLDLSNADVVTCYLLPDINEKLVEKFNRELKPGTRVVSYSFNLPGLQLEKYHRKSIFMYRINE